MRLTRDAKRKTEELRKKEERELRRDNLRYQRLEREFISGYLCRPNNKNVATIVSAAPAALSFKNIWHRCVGARASRRNKVHKSPAVE